MTSLCKHSDINDTRHVPMHFNPNISLTTRLIHVIDSRPVAINPIRQLESTGVGPSITYSRRRNIAKQIDLLWSALYTSLTVEPHTQRRFWYHIYFKILNLIQTYKHEL